MKPHLGFGVFQRIADYAKFKTVRVSFDTIEDEGVDLDPSSFMPSAERQCGNRVDG